MSEQKRLDRPDREEIAKLFYQYAYCGVPDEYEAEWLKEGECIKQACWSFAEKLLALFAPPDRPELEEALRGKITNLAVGMMIIADKLKAEDLGDEDKDRFEEICQLTFDQILALLDKYYK